MSYFDTAREVLRRSYRTGESVAEVLNARFPVSPGGVGHANARVQRETRKRIREWLEPGESNEPTFGGACG